MTAQGEITSLPRQLSGAVLLAFHHDCLLTKYRLQIVSNNWPWRSFRTADQPSARHSHNGSPSFCHFKQPISVLVSPGMFAPRKHFETGCGSSWVFALQRQYFTCLDLTSTPTKSPVEVVQRKVSPSSEKASAVTSRTRDPRASHTTRSAETSPVYGLRDHRTIFLFPAVASK